jgi:hypothetical protein
MPATSAGMTWRGSAYQLTWRGWLSALSWPGLSRPSTSFFVAAHFYGGSRSSWPSIAVQRTACFRTPMSRPSTSWFLAIQQDVDARDKRGHDVERVGREDVDARHKACARAGLRPDPSAGHDELRGNTFHPPETLSRSFPSPPARGQAPAGIQFQAITLLLWVPAFAGTSGP